MNKILGFDPATVTGWSYLEDDKLKDFGNIVCPSTWPIQQQLHFYHTEVQRVITRFNPDYCAIEDAILVHMNVKVLVKLARINGVVLQSTYLSSKGNVEVYKPTYWKANSIPAINGSSPKWKIQLETARFFGIDVVGDFIKWDNKISQLERTIDDKRTDVHSQKAKIDKMKAVLKRKRDPLTGPLKAEHENKIKIITSEHVKGKKELTVLQKKVDKDLTSIGNDIYSQTGLSPDIADATCIAYCLHRGLKNG